VLFIDASQGFETAKNQNKLRPEDIAKIVETYAVFHEGKSPRGIIEEKYSFVATFEEIKENEFNLNIPRYVDTFVEEEEVDITAVQKEIAELNAELVKTEKEMEGYIRELGF
jgi:type I restriction enzyme M protein